MPWLGSVRFTRCFAVKRPRIFMTRDKQPRDNSVVGLDSCGVLQILNAMLIRYLNSLKLQKLKETTFYGDFGN